MNNQEAAKRVLDRLKNSAGDGRWDDHLSLATWEWPQGVAMFAMAQELEASGSAALREEMTAWYDGHIARGLPGRNINTTAPMLGLVMLWEQTREPRWEQPIRDWAEWVMSGLPRTEEGGFQHRTSDCENAQQLWDDTLFMTVLFLYRAGRALREPAWQEEARYQFLLHIKYLHCQKTGLWYHGWTFDGRHHFGEAFWCRGNSWFTAGAADFVSWLPEEDPVRRCVLETWREQCRELVRLQDPETGLWHTLLDDPGSYLETSGSAAIVYGLHKGWRLGLLGEECLTASLKATEGVAAQIAEDGTVQGVSYGTPMGMDMDFYRNVPLQATAYGQGLAYLMFMEMNREN